MHDRKRHDNQDNELESILHILPLAIMPIFVIFMGVEDVAYVLKSIFQNFF